MSSAPFRPDSTILFIVFDGFVKLNVGFVRVNVAPNFNLVFHLTPRDLKITVPIMPVYLVYYITKQMFVQSDRSICKVHIYFREVTIATSPERSHLW